MATNDPSYYDLHAWRYSDRDQAEAQYEKLRARIEHMRLDLSQLKEASQKFQYEQILDKALDER